MKTKTITALDQALADMGCNKPKQPGEFTITEIRKSSGGTVPAYTIQRRLNALVESGEYTRRKLGRDFLYRKAGGPGLHSDHDA
jgi:hypothetical protein